MIGSGLIFPRVAMLPPVAGLRRVSTPGNPVEAAVNNGSRRAGKANQGNISVCGPVQSRLTVLRCS